MKFIFQELTLALTFALLAMSSEVNAQQAVKMPRVGFLWPSAPGAPSPLVDAFRQGLREHGWIDGQNVAIEFRYAEGKPERFPALVEELVSLPIDVIVAGPAPAALAATKATATIPIVITLGADPLAFGLNKSNVTGLTEITPELTPKRLGFLKEMMPKLSRVALLWQSGSLREDTISKTTTEARNTARTLGLQI
jgi:putative tryptophan/tyrosine transport system substrate-binding protein